MTITSRLLLSHLGGFRHYNTPTGASFDSPEYFSNVPYKSVTEAIGYFKDEELAYKPGVSMVCQTTAKSCGSLKDMGSGTAPSAIHCSAPPSKACEACA